MLDPRSSRPRYELCYSGHAASPVSTPVVNKSTFEVHRKTFETVVARYLLCFAHDA